MSFPFICVKFDDTFTNQIEINIFRVISAYKGEIFKILKNNNINI